MATSYSYYAEQFTAGDTAKRIVTNPLFLKGVDIQVLTHDVDVGGRNNQTTELSVGDIMSYGAEIPVDLSQIWFVNHSAGSNGVLSITGWLID